MDRTNTARKTSVGRNSCGEKFVALNSVVPKAEWRNGGHLPGKELRNEDLYGKCVHLVSV